MTCKIETLSNSVDKELEALPEDMQARFFWVGELIRSRGLEKVGEPYVKHLQGGLWEMRIKGKDGISRAIYVVAKPKRIVVVRVFVKKTQKTPQKELKIALQRAKEIES